MPFTTTEVNFLDASYGGHGRWLVGGAKRTTRLLRLLVCGFAAATVRVAVSPAELTTIQYSTYKWISMIGPNNSVHLWNLTETDLARSMIACEGHTKTITCRASAQTNAGWRRVVRTARSACGISRRAPPPRGNRVLKGYGSGPITVTQKYIIERGRNGPLFWRISEPAAEPAATFGTADVPIALELSWHDRWLPGRSGGESLVFWDLSSDGPRLHRLPLSDEREEIETTRLSPNERWLLFTVTSKSEEDEKETVILRYADLSAADPAASLKDVETAEQSTSTTSLTIPPSSRCITAPISTPSPRTVK